MCVYVVKICNCRRGMVDKIYDLKCHNMDPLYLALSLYRKRHFDKCIEVCTEILDNQPLDEAAWCLKMRAMTQRVYVDDIETEEFPETDFLDDHAVATAPRPGTSLKTTEPVPKSSL